MKKGKLQQEIYRLDAEYLEYRRKGDEIRAQQAHDLANTFAKQLRNMHEA